MASPLKIVESSLFFLLLSSLLMMLLLLLERLSVCTFQRLSSASASANLLLMPLSFDGDISIRSISNQALYYSLSSSVIGKIRQHTDVQTSTDIKPRVVRGF